MHKEACYSSLAAQGSRKLWWLKALWVYVVLLFYVIIVVFRRVAGFNQTVITL